MLPWRCPVSRGGVSPSQALAWNRRTCRLDTDGRADHRADPGRRADPAGDGPHTTRHPEPVRHPTNDKSGRTPNPEDSNTWRSAPRSSRDLAQFVSLDAELGFICRPPGRARGAGRRVGRDSWMSWRMRALHRLPEPERRVDRAGDGARLAEAPDRQLGEGEPPTRSHRARPARYGMSHHDHSYSSVGESVPADRCSLRVYVRALPSPVRPSGRPPTSAGPRLTPRPGNVTGNRSTRSVNSPR